MSWFKHKKENASGGITYGASGMLTAQKNIKDPVFSQGMMGEAYGIVPEDPQVYAPFDGVVEMTFPTGHAVGLKREDGLEMLIHIGLDTVSLKGEGFEQLVSEKQRVKKNQPLVRFDPDLVRSKGLDPTVIFVITAQPEKPVQVPSTEKKVQYSDTAIEE